MNGTTTPPVISIRRDAVHREVRIELSDWRNRTGGVYDLEPAEQETFLLPGHLPPHKPFLPDFVIVYGTGEPITASTPEGPVDSIRWHDLRLHVGGPGWGSVQKGLVSHARLASSAEWHNLDSILHGNRRVGGRTDPAPGWLVELIRLHTPFGTLLDPAPGATER